MVDIAAWTTIALLVAWGVVYRRPIAALWFSYEDPRTMAALRIATGVLVLGWLVDLWPLLDYLFTSEGLTTAEQARARWGRYGPWSPLWWRDDSLTVHIHATTLGLAALAMTVGVATRVSSATTWLLMPGLIVRGNPAAAGEQVFAIVLLSLMLSRCGRAWSVDAWWAGRRGNTKPWQIPAWPRNLLLLQLLGLFWANGLAKHGAVWRSGDALHYMLAHPHFRPTDVLGPMAAIGPLPLTVASYVVHGFELLFFLALIGVVRQRLRDRSIDPLSPWRRRVGWAAGLALGSSIAWLTTANLQGAARGSAVFVVSLAVAALVAGGPLVVAAARRLPTPLLDLVLGYRLWLALWLAFTLPLTFVLNIGWFAPMTMCIAIVLVDGEQRSGLPPPAPKPPPMSTGHRRLVGALCCVHIVFSVAVALPAERPRSPWRAALEEPMRHWIRQAVFTQTWRMFAPSTPRAIVDTEAVIIDGDGNQHAVGGGIIDVDRAQSAWSRNKRRKLRRRMASPRGSEQVRRWHAESICRRFAAHWPGPTTVVLTATKAPLVPPQKLAATGAEAAREWAESERVTRQLLELPCPEPG